MENQPLNINLDLSKVVTTIPLIADGHVAHVRLKNITQGDRDGVTVIKWEFALLDPAPTTEGNEVKPGFPLFVNFALDQEWLIQKMSKFVDGLLGTGDSTNTKGKPVRPAFNAQLVEQLIGLDTYAKVVVTRSKKSDYVGNDIQQLIYRDDLPAAVAA